MTATRRTRRGPSAPAARARPEEKKKVAGEPYYQIVDRRLTPAAVRALRRRVLRLYMGHNYIWAITKMRRRVLRLYMGHNCIWAITKMRRRVLRLGAVAEELGDRALPRQRQAVRARVAATWRHPQTAGEGGGTPNGR